MSDSFIGVKEMNSRDEKDRVYADLTRSPSTGVFLEDFLTRRPYSMEAEVKATKEATQTVTVARDNMNRSFRRRMFRLAKENRATTALPNAIRPLKAVSLTSLGNMMTRTETTPM
jgi:hypothetical protein